jgi:uncharacterized protein (TIGR02646 family)
MIQLASKELKSELQKVLDELQAVIDSEPTFSEKQKIVKTLWGNKGNAKNKRAFEVIKSELFALCINVGICNYCEQNEANDIEHVFPKSFFPKYTFSWQNYILACKQCNSAYKLDRCAIIVEDTLKELARGEEPENDNYAFINPRIEDPNNYMVYNSKTFQFDILPHLSQTEKWRADNTIDVLKLNTRDTLKVSRKNSYKHYYEILSRLTKILESKNIEALKNNLNPIEDRFDFSKPIDELKLDIINSYKNYVTKYQHPSVWYSIKLIESKSNSYWQALFQNLPNEVLSW